MQVSFDFFTEQTKIVKREKRKYLEARQDWQRAPISFDFFTEQTKIVKREKRKYLEARQDWQRAPKIIVTEEYIALDKKLEPIEEELFALIKQMPLAVEKRIKGKI